MIKWADELWTADEVAEALRVHPATLRRWRACDEGPPWLLVAGTALRYRRSDVEAYLEGLVGDG